MPEDRIVRKLVICCLLAACCGALLPRHLQAQEGLLGRAMLGAEASANPLLALRARLGQAGTAATALPLEGPLDPATYRVGPGDVFNVSIGGLDVATPVLTVAADGHLLLPEAGSVAVAGLTLGEAYDRLQARLRQSYQNVAIEIALAQPRQFYVHVAGAVPLPGRYLALPVSRVADVLDVAFTDTLHAPVGNLDYRPAFRNITIRHTDGREQAVDLVRYFATGDPTFNPYLDDGDVVFVPAYAPHRSSVYIDGDVAFPGAYDHRPSDTVQDLLAVATGGSALPESVRLTRTRADGTLEVAVLDAATLRSGPPHPLHPLDHLAVGPDPVLRGTVTVGGAVQHPGTYPIVAGQTTLQQLVERAGGLQADALPAYAYLERAALPMPEVQLEDGSRLTPSRPALSRPDTVAILQSLRLAQLDFLSRVYLAEELRLQGRVAVDLATALQPDAAPIYLHHGDRLTVPHDDQTVYVFGQVVQPGYVAYQPGLPAARYLAEAGGPSPLAGEAFVIRAGTGEYLPADGVVLQSGDRLFVDRAEDIANTPELQRLILEESRARADARLRTFQLITQTVSALVSLILVYSVRRGN